MNQDFFHTNLRRARERAGLSQAELADDIGVGRTTYVALESGRTRLYSKRVDAIAGRLGITPEELLFGERAPELLQEAQPLSEWKATVVAGYEKKLSELEEKLKSAREMIDLQAERIRNLDDTNRYLLQQLRKD